ncbi:membrane protein [Staphylococcus aureus]|nr:membrane protein [Staphylococcus aureus]
MNKFIYFLIVLLSVFLIFNFVNSILFNNPFDFLESFIYSLVFTLIFLGLEGYKEKKK